MVYYGLPSFVAAVVALVVVGVAKADVATVVVVVGTSRVVVVIEVSCQMSWQYNGKQ